MMIEVKLFGESFRQGTTSFAHDSTHCGLMKKCTCRPANGHTKVRLCQDLYAKWIPRNRLLYSEQRSLIQNRL